MLPIYIVTLYCVQYKCSVSLSEVCAAEFYHTYLLCLSLLSVTGVCVCHLHNLTNHNYRDSLDQNQLQSV